MNFQDDAATVSSHWRESLLSFPSFLQHGDSASRAFGVEFYTSMFLLDTDFRVLWRGHFLAEPTVKEILGMKP